MEEREKPEISLSNFKCMHACYNNYSGNTRLFVIWTNEICQTCVHLLLICCNRINVHMHIIIMYMRSRLQHAVLHRVQWCHSHTNSKFWYLKACGYFLKSFLKGDFCFFAFRGDFLALRKSDFFFGAWGDLVGASFKQGNRGTKVTSFNVLAESLKVWANLLSLRCKGIVNALVLPSTLCITWCGIIECRYER